MGSGMVDGGDEAEDWVVDMAPAWVTRATLVEDAGQWNVSGTRYCYAEAQSSVNSFPGIQPRRTPLRH